MPMEGFDEESLLVEERKLWRSSGIPILRSLERDRRSAAADKRTELRERVGLRYRAILQASENLKGMKILAKDALDSFNEIPRKMNILKEAEEEFSSFSFRKPNYSEPKKHRLHTADDSVENRSKNDLNDRELISNELAEEIYTDVLDHDSLSIAAEKLKMYEGSDHLDLYQLIKFYSYEKIHVSDERSRIVDALQALENLGECSGRFHSMQLLLQLRERQIMQVFHSVDDLEKSAKILRRTVEDAWSIFVETEGEWKAHLLSWLRKQINEVKILLPRILSRISSCKVMAEKRANILEVLSGHHDWNILSSRAMGTVIDIWNQAYHDAFSDASKQVVKNAFKPIVAKVDSIIQQKMSDISSLIEEYNFKEWKYPQISRMSFLRATEEIIQSHDGINATFEALNISAVFRVLTDEVHQTMEQVRCLSVFEDTHGDFISLSRFLNEILEPLGDACATESFISILRNIDGKIITFEESKQLKFSELHCALFLGRLSSRIRQNYGQAHSIVKEINPHVDKIILRVYNLWVYFTRQSIISISIAQMCNWLDSVDATAIKLGWLEIENEVAVPITCSQFIMELLYGIDFLAQSLNNSDFEKLVFSESLHQFRDFIADVFLKSLSNRQIPEIIAIQLWFDFYFLSIALGNCDTHQPVYEYLESQIDAVNLAVCKPSLQKNAFELSRRTGLMLASLKFITSKDSNLSDTPSSSTSEAVVNILPISQPIPRFKRLPISLYPAKIQARVSSTDNATPASADFDMTPRPVAHPSSSWLGIWTKIAGS